jgi:hypothetical protein
MFVSTCCELQLAIQHENRSMIFERDRGCPDTRRLSTVGQTDSRYELKCHHPIQMTCREPSSATSTCVRVCFHVSFLTYLLVSLQSFTFLTVYVLVLPILQVTFSPPRYRAGIFPEPTPLFDRLQGYNCDRPCDCPLWPGNIHCATLHVHCCCSVTSV